jgi:predicted nucleic acid-binding protein
MILKDEDIFKDILLDCDVFRHLHFLKCLEQVEKSVPAKLIMLDIVVAELTMNERFTPIVNDYSKRAIILKMRFPQKNEDILTEHFDMLSNDVGPGESACMSVARFNDDVVGSSNLRDIATYCKTYSISYLTTLDLMFIAVEQGNITEAEFDQAVQDLINNDYRIPNITYQNYKTNNPDLHRQCSLLKAKIVSKSP